MKVDHIEPELLNPKQVATAIGQCRTTVFALIASGEIESTLFSPRKRLVTRDAVNAYIARRREQNHT
jgi:excisionase family DNA binding protein